MIIMPKTRDGVRHTLELKDTEVLFMELIMEEGYNTVLSLSGQPMSVGNALTRTAGVINKPGVLALARAQAEIVRGENRSREALITYPNAYVLFGGDRPRWVFGKFKYNSANGMYLVYE